MRADRLVATLLLLQSRGQVTAAEVAEELEVSERTARRDLEALGTAGLPIYSVQGRNGGWRLAGRRAHRPQRAQRGRGPGPVPRRRPVLVGHARGAGRAAQARAGAAGGRSGLRPRRHRPRLVVDTTGWDQAPGTRPAPPHLDDLQQAVIDGVQMVLGYRARDGATTERTVHPLGLASKGTTWYLVAGTDAGQRTFRVDRVTSVVRTDEPVVRPDDFDLAAAWAGITDAVDELRLPIRAEALVDPDVVGLLRMMFGRRVRIGPAGDDGRVEVEVRGHHVPALAGELAGLGSRVEVLGPPEVRDRLAEIGTELAVHVRTLSDVEISGGLRATTRGTRRAEPTTTTGALMGIGTSIVIMAIGALMTFAVEVDNAEGFDINNAGVILMILGAVGLLVSLVIWGPRRQRTVVDEEVVGTPSRRTVYTRDP